MISFLFGSCRCCRCHRRRRRRGIRRRRCRGRDEYAL